MASRDAASLRERRTFAADGSVAPEVRSSMASESSSATAFQALAQAATMVRVWAS